jgi:hypothetical protein
MTVDVALASMAVIHAPGGFFGVAGADVQQIRHGSVQAG